MKCSDTVPQGRLTFLAGKQQGKPFTLSTCHSDPRPLPNNLPCFVSCPLLPAQSSTLFPALYSLHRDLLLCCLPHVGSAPKIDTA